MEILITGPVGSPIQTFSISHCVGFGKSLAAKQVLLVVNKLNLSDADLLQIAPELLALLSITYTYSPSATIKDEVNKALLSKMMANDRMRPTCVHSPHKLLPKESFWRM